MLNLGYQEGKPVDDSTNQKLRGVDAGWRVSSVVVTSVVTEREWSGVESAAAAKQSRKKGV